MEGLRPRRSDGAARPPRACRAGDRRGTWYRAGTDSPVVRQRIAIPGAERPHPLHDVLAVLPEGVVIPRSGRRLDDLPQTVPPDLCPKRLRHIAAAAAVTGKMVDLVDQFLRQ